MVFLEKGKLGKSHVLSIISLCKGCSKNIIMPVETSNEKLIAVIGDEVIFVLLIVIH